MLKRPLNDDQFEYEIQYSTKEIEQKFYEYFLEYMKNIKFDIDDYQIIINPIEFRMEIRIKMNKLYRCFACWFDLNMLHEYRGGTGRIAFTNVCETVIKPIKEYARSLCYKD